MQRFGNLNLSVSQVVGLGVVLAMLLVIACGAAATATPQPAPTTAPAATAAPTVAPAATAVPTAAPAATSTPVPVTETRSGKIVLATSDWGNELFSDHDIRGEGGVYARNLMDFLLHGKAGKEVVGGAAESWSFTPDGLTWTFKIRDGMVHHNGTPVTAEDIAYSMEQSHGARGETDAVSSTHIRMAKVTEPWMVTGPNEVSVTTTDVQMFFPFYLSEMFAGPRGVLYSKDAYQGCPVTDRCDDERAAFNENPNPYTAGPFELTRHDRGSLMRFEVFEDYWKIDERNYRFQTLEMRRIPELSTRLAAIRSGEADIVEANPEVQDQIKDAGGQIVWGPESQYIWMIQEGCYVEEAVIPCDKRIRQALNYAIDKETIGYTLYGRDMADIRGIAYANPSGLGYEPGIDPFPYDPEKAKALLAEAGCADASCFPDPYELYTWDASEVPFMLEVAQLVCQYWNENLGINCKLAVSDSGTVKDLLHGFKIPGYFAVRPNEDRFDGGSAMYTGYVATDAPTKLGAQPYPGMVDGDEVAALQEAVSNAVGLIGTMDERHKAYHEMWVRVREMAFEWSLMSINTPWGVGPQIASWEPWPMMPYASALWTVELNK